MAVAVQHRIICDLFTQTLLSADVRTHWTNALATYFITNERVIGEFRLLLLVQGPLRKVRAVKESKSPNEAIVGVGNILVSGGGDTGLGIAIQNVYVATDFADQLRSPTAEVVD